MLVAPHTFWQDDDKHMSFLDSLLLRGEWPSTGFLARGSHARGNDTQESIIKLNNHAISRGMENLEPICYPGIERSEVCGDGRDRDADGVKRRWLMARNHGAKRPSVWTAPS